MHNHIYIKSHPISKYLTSQVNVNTDCIKIMYYIMNLTSSLFPDVPLALESWSKSRKIAVYSTGNILGQQLQFTHTTAGDFSSHIHQYFDQTVGSKSEVEAYEKIASKLEVKPEEIVYITDQVEGGYF